MRYLIIGSGIAAVGAVEGIRELDQDGEAILLDAEGKGAYSRPLISYFLADRQKHHNIDYRSRDFFVSNNIQLINARAEKISRREKKVTLENGQDIAYDKLLIATGAAPFSPPVEGINRDWVRCFYTLEDVQSIDSMLPNCKKAVVLGSGLIGLKAAEALVKRGLEVTVVEREGHIMPRNLSKGSASFLTEHLEAKGIRIICSAQLDQIKPDHTLLFKDGSNLEADLLIMAAGTRPQTELAVECGLEVKKAIVVDEQLRTSDEDIFAAGDVIETRNLINGKTEIMALLPHAHEEGYLAGCNMAGKNSIYQGNIFMNSVQLLGWSICSAGQAEWDKGTVLCRKKDDSLLELLIDGEHLLAYLAVNLPEISGPLTNIIKKKISIPEVSWQEFMQTEPSLSSFPPAVWQDIRGVKNYAVS